VCVCVCERERDSLLLDLCVSYIQHCDSLIGICQTYEDGIFKCLLATQCQDYCMNGPGHTRVQGGEDP